jgi:hypothetical protein
MSLRIFLWSRLQKKTEELEELPIFFVNMKQDQQLTTNDQGLLQKILDFKLGGSSGEVSACSSLLSV